MDPKIYEELAAQEDTHWWFCARRVIATSLLKRYLSSSPLEGEVRRGVATSEGFPVRHPLPNPPLKGEGTITILDAGCGSGGNLPMLAAFGSVCGFEMEDAARDRARARAIGPVEAGSLPDAIPFTDAFDLITLFDVLEHIEDDRVALAALASRLKPGGLLLLNVPALQWMFSRYDILHHHFRRYSWSDLQQKVEAAGLTIRIMNYWNFWLFPVVLIVRCWEHIRSPGKSTTEYGSLPPSLNKLLAVIVSSERFLIPRLRLPFGTSIILIAEKC